MFSFVTRSAANALRLPAALAFIAIAATGVALAPVAGAQPLADSGGMRHAVTLASPAVVRIVSVVDGGLICHGCANDGSDIVSPESGEFEFATSGTGSFISSDGYILTADHVVDHTTNNPDDVSSMYDEALQDLAQRSGVQTSDVDTFLQEHASSVEVVVQQKSQKVFLSTAYTGQLQNPSQVVSYDVTRIVASSPVDKQDTAVVKIEAQNMPYLTLAPNSAVGAGDSVTSVGFPGDADEVLANSGDFTSLLDPSQSDVNTINSLLTASVQTGQVTAQKTLADGTAVYETDGIANHGSSGGPVLDTQGKVIGFVDTGTSASRIVNLISSSVAAEYAQQAGVATPKPGNFEALWTKAVNEYDTTGICHFTHAASDLKQLHQQFPEFAGANTMLADAQAKATPQECPPPSNNSGLVVAGAAGVVVLGAAGVVAFFFFRRKRTAPVGAPFAAAPGMYGQPTMVSNGGFVPGQLPVYSTPTSMPMPTPTPMPTSMPTPAPAASFPDALPVSRPVTPLSLPVPAGEAPMGRMPVDSMPFSQPATPAPVSASATVPAMSVHMCVHGHMVQDTTAQFCPHCGGPVQTLVPQA